MIRFEAFHLPGLVDDDIESWDTLAVRKLELRVPKLRPAGLRRLLGRLALRQRRLLLRRRVDRLVRSIDAAAARLADPTDPVRDEAERLLPAVSGYSPAMAARVLDHMVGDWRAPALESLLRIELGEPELLDGFCPDPRAARRVRALGPRLSFHVFAGNVPGVAVTALVRSLLVKSAVLGKTALDDPVLPVLFARALAETDPELGECLAVTYWPGGTEALEAEAGRQADLVVVYGGDAAVLSARASASPHTRVVEHGPRLSFGLIGARALSEGRRDATVDAAARAAALFDQLGCVSPHLYYVEGETLAAAFAEDLAAALGRLQESLPRGSLRPEDAAQIHQFRAAAEFRALAGADVRIHAGAGVQYTVVYDAEPEFEPSCLYRTVWVKPVASLEEVAPLVEPFRGFLQSVAVEGAGDADRLERIAASLATVGVSRVTDLERLPWPAPGSHHDGAPPLGELLRWVDLDDAGESSL